MLNNLIKNYSALLVIRNMQIKPQEDIALRHLED